METMSKYGGAMGKCEIAMRKRENGPVRVIAMWKFGSAALCVNMRVTAMG